MTVLYILGGVVACFFGFIMLIGWLSDWSTSPSHKRPGL